MFQFGDGMVEQMGDFIVVHGWRGFFLVSHILVAECDVGAGASFGYGWWMCVVELEDHASTERAGVS